MIMARALICIMAAALALSACSSGGEPRMMNLNSRNVGPGPDEFSVLPSRPLEMPSDLTALPPPNPGGPNRTDPDPEAEAIAALGGDVTRAATGSQGLMTHATRFGVEGDIRGTLAAEDLAFRQQNNGLFLERMMSVNIYYRAYSSVSLDQYGELERLRSLGVRTPAAPPEDQ